MEAISAAAIGVEDLDPAGVLARIADAERRDREVQLEKLRLAYQWCVQHPATSETGTATWGDAGLPGLSDCDASLGGDGTPGVAPFVAEELGAAMGVSTQAAMSLMADALDLRHRLPRLWALVEDLAVAPWKTRRVAADTRSLPLEAARWVDEQLAARVDGFGLPTIERLVALAAARFAPEEQAENEEAHRSQHHVTLTHPRPGEFAGTSWLEAAGDTQDLTAFYDLVCEEAKRLGRLGDTDDYETRKAKALGIVAGRQGVLDLTGSTGDTVKPRKPVQTNLYVHVSPADLATHAGGAPVVGEVEKLGPATLDLIRSWLADSRARILPVLDLNRTDAVDQHDPPPWMRELVILRDRHCVFPWCGRDARACDLDHIVAYVPPDEGGPPGQTNPQNLAPLCRRHHRAKTFTGWTYQRQRNGTYTGPARTTHLDRRTRRNEPYDRALTRPGGPSRGVHPRHLTRAVSGPPERPARVALPTQITQQSPGQIHLDGR